MAVRGRMQSGSARAAVCCSRSSGRRRDRSRRAGRARRLRGPERLDARSASPGASRRDRAGRRPDRQRPCASTSTSAGGGFVIVRKDVRAHAAGELRLHLPAPRRRRARNNFEFKLVDPRATNVWWRVQRDYPFPRDWQHVDDHEVAPRVRLGPGAAAAPKQVGAIEIAISTRRRRQGLDLDRRPPARGARGRRAAPTPPKVTRVDARCPGTSRALVLDDDPQTSWRSGALADEQWLQLDFAAPARVRRPGHRLGSRGLRHRATASRSPTTAQNWTLAYASTAATAAASYVYMPDGESRYVRLALEQSSRGQGYGIRALAVQPLEFSGIAEPVLRRDRRASRRPARIPKYFTGQQTYWTVVGVDGDDKEALLNEEGMLEVEQGRASRSSRSSTSTARSSPGATSQPTQALDDGYLPIPSVTWQHGDVALRVTAFAAGDAGRVDALRALRRREPARDRAARRRPLPRAPAVPGLPPWQSLNMVGGVAPIQHDRASTAGAVWVNGDKPVVLADAARSASAPRPSRSGLADRLPARTARCRRRPRVTDRFGFASGALALRPDASTPGASAEVAVAVPFHDPATPSSPPAGDPMPEVRDRLARACARGWEERLGRVELRAAARRRAASSSTLKSTLAYILINRDGPRAPARARAPTRARGSATARSPRRRCSQMGFTERGRATSSLVRAVPAARRHGSVLRRPPRRRPGARARQQRRVHLRGRASTTATRATSASCTRCGRTWCAPSTTSTRCARQRTTDAYPSAGQARPSTACCPSRSATRATPRIRCTPTGTTSSRCAA